MTDDRRLLDDPTIAPELRHMLEAARADAPSAAASARMMAHLDAVAAAGPAAAGASVLPWIAGLLAVIAAVVVAVWVGRSQPLSSSSPGSSEVRPPVRPAGQIGQQHVETLTPSPPEAAPDPAVVLPSPETAPAAPSAEAEIAPTPPRADAEPAQPPPAPAPETPPAPPSELEIIKQAHAALARGEHAVATAHVRRHRQLYARGLLAEERDAIAIEALVGLERTEAARTQLDAFEQRYPASSYRARLQKLVDALAE